MTNTTTALIIVMFINTLMFLSQVAMSDINPDSNTLYNYKGSVMSQFDNGNQTLNTESLDSYIPNADDGQLDTSTGNVFTDIFKSIKNFLFEVPGVKYLALIVTAPYTILNGIFSEHKEMAFALGTFWWGITIFLIVSFIWGRE